jgi:TonB family protein
MPPLVVSTVVHGCLVFYAFGLAEDAMGPPRQRARAMLDVDVVLLGSRAAGSEADAATHCSVVEGAEAISGRATEVVDRSEAERREAATARTPAQAKPDGFRSPTSRQFRDRKRFDEREAATNPASIVVRAHPDAEAGHGSEEPEGPPHNADPSREPTSEKSEASLGFVVREQDFTAKAGSVEGKDNQKASNVGQRLQTGGSRRRGGNLAPPGSVAWERIRKAIQQRMVYPRLSRRLRWQGRVVVGFDVGPNGGVEDIHVLRSSGHAALDRSALAAVAHAAPLPVVGQRLRVELPLVFVLR